MPAAPAAIVRTESHNPWRNLGLEEYLVEAVAAGRWQTVLYLWQNRDTVVIGRNQNVWKECLAAQLEAEGGSLARRSTGGGAVFHDLGNLNFSIIAPRRRFSLDDNFALILDAVSRVGIHAERSGRNDILADGRKFSGNAFSLKRDVGLHHGTLLVRSDYARIARYLTVSPAKLAAKGVSSVRSRIVNLTELNPELTVEQMAAAMEDAYRRHFCADPQRCPQVELLNDDDFTNLPRLDELSARYASWDWRFGESLQFDAEAERRFAWGLVQIGFQVSRGQVQQARLYSDALDSDLLARVPEHLNGHRFHSADLCAALTAMPLGDPPFGSDRRQIIDDLCAMIREQNW